MSGGGAEGGGVAKEKKGAKGRQCAMPNELLDELTRKLPRPHASLPIGSEDQGQLTLLSLRDKVQMCVCDNGGTNITI